MSQPEAMADPCSDGDHVFHGASDLDANRIGARVEAKGGPGECCLNCFSEFPIGGRHHKRGWIALSHFAEARDIRLELFANEISEG